MKTESDDIMSQIKPMKTIVLTSLLIFTALSYSFSQYRHYKDDLSKRVEFFVQIADSLESSHQFKKYPIDSDSAGYIKGFFLCVNKIKQRDRIVILAHHFVGIGEAHRYSTILRSETFNTYVNRIVIKRDSLCYLLFGNDSKFFRLAGSDYLRNVFSKGRNRNTELAILYAREHPEEEEYYISKYAAKGISLEKYYNPTFIEFVLLPIYKDNRKRNKIVDWVIQ